MILHFLSSVVLAATPVTRVASYYADQYEGCTMADGRPFQQSGMTCASNDWPLGTRLKIQSGERAIVVRVTDRMAARFSGKRVDLTQTAFRALSRGGLYVGLIEVEVTPVK